jgi:hypothetical protein
VSYNQPKLSPCAQWDPNGIILTNLAEGSFEPTSIFVDRNNTVYVADRLTSRVYAWHVGSTTTTITITLDSFSYASLFVTIDGSIYVGSGESGKVEKWALNATKGVIVMNAGSYCFGLFVDINNSIYCSLVEEHRVVKQSFDGDVNKFGTVAGNGSPEFDSDTLDSPLGIFVDINFDLYVADYGNDRVQLFRFGHTNGVTLAGDGAPFTIELYSPRAVFLDADRHLFIVDQSNQRIIGSKSNGFYCVVGCSEDSDVTSNQLSPYISAAFDNYGNIFVADRDNSRIQKFNLMANVSSK